MEILERKVGDALDIGELRHRIIIQKQEITTNENGFEEEEWTHVKTVWAGVNNLYGKEYFEAAAIQMENAVKFTIRYVAGLDTTMRVCFRGKSYNIISIDNIKYGNRFIVIQGVEVDLSG